MKIINKDRLKHADLKAALLGAFSALALPPLYWLPVLLFTVPALLRLIDATPRWQTAMRRGLWFGFAHHIVGLYWVTDAILVESADYWWFIPLAVPGLALLLAPFIALACGIARMARPGWRRAVTLAAAWVLGDLARQFIGTGFPWNPWGSVWAMPGWAGDVFIQPAAWIGVHGLTLLTVLLASTPTLGRKAMAGGALTLMAWAGFGILRLSQGVPPAPNLDIVLVQGNVPQGEKWDANRAGQVFQLYLDLTRAGVARAGSGPILVVWPESSFPGLLDQDEAARQAIAQAAFPALATLVGSVRFEGSPAQAGARPHNSLIAVRPDAKVGGIYDKWHLVPGGEYAPSWLPFAVQLVPGGGFMRGRGPTSLHLPGLPTMGPLICYEAIFPAQVINEADRPAFMVNITNDAWFGNSSGPRQHLVAARLRAVEEGMPLLRAANTGISVAFDAYGREISRVGLQRRDVMIIKLPGALPKTPFARLGLAIPFVLAGLVLASGLVEARRPRIC